MRETKLLSYCLPARNDNYGGNFQYIFTTALNLLGRNLGRIGALDDVEVLIGDWNSEVGLAETMALCPEARSVTRFVRVPPPVAARYSPPGKSFNSAIAGNVVYRRASGEFILSTNADVLFSAPGLRCLLDLLRGRVPVPFSVSESLLLIRRKMLPWELVLDRPEPAVIERFIFENTWCMETGASWTGLNGNNAASVAHRRIWHETRGIDESMAGWGWHDIDFGLRVNQRYPSYHLNELGVMGYEMDIPPERRKKAINDAGHNRALVKLGMAANGEDWGLGAEDLATELPTGPLWAPVSESAPPPDKAAVLEGLCSGEVAAKIEERINPSIRQQSDFPAGYLMGYWALTFGARTFLDLDFMGGAAALCVPAVCRCVDVIGVDSWERRRVVPVATLASDVYRHFGHVGGLHFLTGDPEAALDRLSPILGDRRIDLAYVHVEDWSTERIQSLEKLRTLLAPRAAIVLHAAADVDYGRALARVLSLFDRAAVVASERDRTALVFSGSGAEFPGSLFGLEARLFEALRPPQGPPSASG